MTKPGNYLGWVPSGSGSYITAPTVGQKATGWAFGEAPPFEYMNWLFYYTDQWIQWFDSVLTPGAAGLNATPTVLVTTGNITLNSDQLTGLASVVGIQPGQVVTGTGFAAGTLVQAISGSTVRLSIAATATFSPTVTFSHQWATGSNIQTQLDELDAAINTNRTYDIIVGSGPGSTHTGLAEAVADSNYGANQRVLVTITELSASPIVLSKAGWRITMLPGQFLGGGTTIGYQISASGVELYNCRFDSIATAVQFQAGGTYGRVVNCNFHNFTTAVDDSAVPAGKKAVVTGSIAE